MAKGLKIALIVVLVVAVLGGGVAGIISLVDSDKFDTKNISDLSFGVGGLDSAGKYMSTDQSIYTKDAFECQGLNVSLEFDSEISYQIYFYDQNNDFVHTTGKLEGAFVADSIPFFAKYARIVITPDDDEKVTSLEVLKYAKQLNAKVNREQGFKNYTEDLSEIEFTDSGIDASGEVFEKTGSCVLKMINVSNYKEAMIFKFSGNVSPHWLSFYNSNKEFLGQGSLSNMCSVFVSSENITYASVRFDNVIYQTEGSATGEIAYFRMTTTPTDMVHIYCR